MGPNRVAGAVDDANVWGKDSGAVSGEVSAADGTCTVPTDRPEKEGQIGGDAAQRDHIGLLQDLLMNVLMYTLLPHMAQTIESLGQAHVSYRPLDKTYRQVDGGVGGLQTFFHERWRKTLLCCHPLWQLDHSQVTLAREEAAQRFEDVAAGSVIMLNPFRAIRRPSDYC